MTYGTELRLLIAWLAVALLAAIVLAVVLLIRQPPRQDEWWQTVRRYFGLSALICCAFPVLLLAAATSVELYNWAGPTILAYWWVPLVLVAAGAVVAGGVLVWRWERNPRLTAR